jgi:threonine/homoserine/homoserine lactone efflux protein
VGPAIGDLLPSAIAVALSPGPIIAVILVLGTRRARPNGSAFALGWIIGLVMVATVVVLIAGDASDTDSATSTAADAVKLALGAVLMLLAIPQWRKRPRPGTEATVPKWMKAMDGLSTGKSFGLGAAFSSANPKNLALTLAAAASIAQAGLAGAETALAVGIFVLIGSITVAGPVVFSIVASRRAAGPLNSIKEFMSEHNAVIMFLLLLVLGAKLAGQGLAGLTD